MDVYYYDIVEKLPLGNASKCSSLNELLKTADIVSVHVDGQAGNRNLFGEKQFRLMKDEALFLNLSRGFVVDMNSLAGALKSGKLGGAAVDVDGDPLGDGGQPRSQASPSIEPVGRPPGP